MDGIDEGISMPMPPQQNDSTKKPPPPAGASSTLRGGISEVSALLEMLSMPQLVQKFNAKGFTTIQQLLDDEKGWQSVVPAGKERDSIAGYLVLRAKKDPAQQQESERRMQLFADVKHTLKSLHELQKKKEKLEKGTTVVNRKEKIRQELENLLDSIDDAKTHLSEKQTEIDRMQAESKKNKNKHTAGGSSSSWTTSERSMFMKRFTPKHVNKKAQPTTSGGGAGDPNSEAPAGSPRLANESPMKKNRKQTTNRAAPGGAASCGGASAAEEGFSDEDNPGYGGVPYSSDAPLPRCFADVDFSASSSGRPGTAAPAAPSSSHRHFATVDTTATVGGGGGSKRPGTATGVRSSGGGGFGSHTPNSANVGMGAGGGAAPTSSAGGGSRPCSSAGRPSSAARAAAAPSEQQPTKVWGMKDVHDVGAGWNRPPTVNRTQMQSKRLADTMLRGQHKKNTGDMSMAVLGRRANPVALGVNLEGNNYAQMRMGAIQRDPPPEPPATQQHVPHEPQNDGEEY